MGRIAGVSADDTRQKLLAAAAKVFARSGYDGSSIAAITAEAGLSSGAVYSHYRSKAELFAAVLHTHGEQELMRLLGERAEVDVASVMVELGSRFDRRTRREGSLLVEAIVAAKRNPDVARVLAESFAEREDAFADLLRQGQRGGALRAGASAAAVARFSMMLSLGSLLIGALDLPPTDHDDWAALIGRLVDTFRTKEYA